MKRLQILRFALFQKRLFYSTDIRVRFAPSPTGKLHLGSLRTALFNYLFARSQQGVFLLRIEDTDQQRVVDGSVDEIQHLLDVYGLRRDEGPREGGAHGPYVQSKRTHLYREAAEQLVEEEHAYRCFCTSERLEVIRKTAYQQKTNLRYDNRCRALSKEESKRRAGSELYTIRFKLDPGIVSFDDVNYGTINYTVDEGDFVILKSDLFPTYHLANVVDDLHMRISHVIRGQEWLPSTAKHVRLYKALHFQPPVWVHLPLITRDGKQKLSKRDADAFVEYYYNQKGYLRSALLNFLIRNGSGIQNFDRFHLYTLDDMVQNFDPKLLGTRSLQMDTFALDSYGRRAIRLASYDELYDEMRHFLSTQMPDCEPHLFEADYLRKVLDFLLHNEENFSHLAQLVKSGKTKNKFSFLFTKPHGVVQSPPGLDSATTRRCLEHLVSLSDSQWTVRGLQQVSQQVGLSYKKLFLLLRLAIIDSDVGPPVMELVDFFGVAECRKRLEAQLNWM